jgi:hypothetical protein
MEVFMDKEEILKELLNQTEDEVQSVILNYIVKTNQYAKYIEFIAKLSAKQQEELTRKIVKTKAVANALQFQPGFDDLIINKDNWFVWMRYLDVTEDRTTPSMNFRQPIVILEKIHNIIQTININNDPEYEYLLKRYWDLRCLYKI